MTAVFFPQPLIDGFSKLWLRGKGNLRVETLIPAGSVLGLHAGSRARAKNVQKQQYLQGFLQKTYKNITFYIFSAKNIQKQQYLQGFLQTTCKNDNIYKVF